MTQSTREDLEAVFGPFREVAAVELRPEPEYWVAHFDSPDERNRAVLEATRQMPRPCIVYTSKREHASQLFAMIRTQNNVQRVALVRGGDLSSNGPVDSVIAQWESGDLDIIVATSAFGLGVDNRDARTIIHACVPESVDRFYQELGRAGRDGRPSISLLLWCDSDLDVARSLATERYIGDEKGWGRWRSMFAYQLEHSRDPELVGLPIDRVPVWLDQSGDNNRAWNLRTLNLMQRAGVLRLEVDTRATSTEDQDLQRARIVWARIRAPEAANSYAAWRDHVGSVRARLIARGADDLSMVTDALLSCRHRFADLFAGQYEISSVAVVRETGPDPLSRLQAPFPPAPRVLPCPVLIDPAPVIQLPFTDFRPGTAVEIPTSWEIDDTIGVIVELISRGFSDVALPSSLLAHPQLIECDRRSPSGYVALRDVTSRCGIEWRTAQYDLLTSPRIVYLPNTFPLARARSLVARLRNAKLASFILIEPGLREAAPPFRPFLSVLEGPRIRADILTHRLRHGPS